MKEYTNPELEVLYFATEDIITDSPGGEEGGGGGNF